MSSFHKQDNAFQAYAMMRQGNVHAAPQQRNPNHHQQQSTQNGNNVNQNLQQGILPIGKCFFF